MCSYALDFTAIELNVQFALGPGTYLQSGLFRTEHYSVRDRHIYSGVVGDAHLSTWEMVVNYI
jgi:hypothetical protein